MVVYYICVLFVCACMCLCLFAVVLYGCFRVSSFVYFASGCVCLFVFVCSRVCLFVDCAYSDLIIIG